MPEFFTSIGGLIAGSFLQDGALWALRNIPGFPPIIQTVHILGIAVVMGSDSDWPVMEAAAEALEQFGIGLEVHVLSAHRTPDAMIAYGRAAAGKGIRVIIAGAGGAANLGGGGGASGGW